MAEVIIYTTNTCPYCDRAKMLLQQKGLSYDEINVADAQIRDEMIERAGGRRTVPQIFINGTHVGGFDDMYALNQQGKLDEIIGA
jgi:glutaredoxin 3